MDVSASLKADLWEAWRTRRDERAFEALVRAEIPALYDAARRRGLRADEADDVVQDALIELAQQRGEKPGKVGVGAWLMRQVLSNAFNLRRSTTRRARYEGAPGERVELPPTSRADVREEIDRALDRLDADDRQIVLFRYVYDLEYREIAYVLGVSENACRIRAHRACGRLRTHLGPNALALLVTLSLAEPASAATQVTTAITSAGSAGAGILGGVAMTTAAKIGVAAVASAALTAGVMSWTRPNLSGPDEPRRLSDEGRPTTPADQTAAAGPQLGAAPSAEEMEWTRNALRQERERRRAATILPSDTGIAVAERVIEHGADPWPLLFGDFAAIAGHVEPAPGRVARFESTGDLTQVDAYRPALPDGTEVIEFGPGTFRVKNLGRRRGVEKGVGHLEIRGAGVQATTLLLDDSAVYSGARHEHVRVHDLTVDLREHDLVLDEREGAAFLLERVHVKDWASGGHSAAIGTSGLAYLACKDCTFELTTRNGGAFAVSLRGPAVVAFDRCSFLGPMSVIGGQRSAQGSRVALRDCVFEDSVLADSRVIYGPGKRTSIAIRVRGGTVSFGQSDWTDEQRRERWGAGHAEEISNVAFRSTVRVAPPSDLARILRGASLLDGDIVHQFVVTEWREGSPSALRLDAWNPKKGPFVYSVRLSESGAWETKVDERSGSTSPPDGIREAPEMSEALSRVTLPAGSGLRGARFVVVRRPRKDAPVLGLALDTGGDRYVGGEGTVIDPATGKPFEN